MLTYILVVLAVIICGLLILLVLVQNSKGGGLNSSFGGVNQATNLFGVRNTNSFAEKGTWYLALALVLITYGINLSYMLSSNAPSNLRTQQQIDQLQLNTAPTGLPAFGDESLDGLPTEEGDNAGEDGGENGGDAGPANGGLPIGGEVPTSEPGQEDDTEGQ